MPTSARVGHQGDQDGAGGVEQPHVSLPGNRIEQMANSWGKVPNIGRISRQNEPASRIVAFSLEILNGLLGKRMTGGHIRT